MPVFEEPVTEEPVIRPKMRKYEKVLVKVMDDPGVWKKIGSYGSEGSAYQAATNLNRRKYKIPDPEGGWQFVASDVEVFALYDKDTKREKPAPKATKKAAKKTAKKTAAKA